MTDLILSQVRLYYILLQEKTHKRNASAVVFLKDPEFLQRRVAALQQRAHELFDDFEQSYCKE